LPSDTSTGVVSKTYSQDNYIDTSNVTSSQRDFWNQMYQLPQLINWFQCGLNFVIIA